jgi:glucose-1-phosphate adenylyltransferase
MGAPIFTRPRFLPASKINGAQINHAIISDGCIINHARVNHSLVGVRSTVSEGCELTRTVMMGCDYYESDASIRQYEAQSIPRIGI